MLHTGEIIISFIRKGPSGLWEDIANASISCYNIFWYVLTLAKGESAVLRRMP